MGRKKKKRPEVVLMERARSGRSRCRACKEFIKDKSLRYGVLTSSPDFGDYYKYYHPTCAEKEGFKMATKQSEPSFQEYDYNYYIHDAYRHYRVRNGREELFCLYVEPTEDHAVGEFILKLTQTTGTGLEIGPTLVYNSAKAKTGAPLTIEHSGKDVIWKEVPRIKDLMSLSLLRTTRTPADVFALGHLLADKKKKYEKNLVMRKAAEISAQKHRTEFSCVCNTATLMIHGCSCGALEREQQEKNTNAVEHPDALVSPSANVFSTNLKALTLAINNFSADLKADVEDIKADVAAAVADMKKEEPLPLATEPNTKVDIKAGSEIEVKMSDETPELVISTDEQGTKPEFITAKSVLDAIVSTKYADLAEEIAVPRARVDVEGKALVPGMKVYHKISGHRYILLQLKSEGWLACRMADNEEVIIHPALLSCSPNVPAVPEKHMALLYGLGLSFVFYTITAVLVVLMVMSS